MLKQTTYLNYKNFTISPEDNACVKDILTNLYKHKMICFAFQRKSCLYNKRFSYCENNFNAIENIVGREMLGFELITAEDLTRQLEKIGS